MERNIWPASSQIFENDGWSGGRKPCLMAFVSTASSCFLPPSVIMPHHAWDAYVSLDTRVALVTSHKFGPFIPWDRSNRRAYIVCADLHTSLSTWSWIDRSYRSHPQNIHNKCQWCQGSLLVFLGIYGSIETFRKVCLTHWCLSLIFLNFWPSHIWDSRYGRVKTELKEILTLFTITYAWDFTTTFHVFETVVYFSARKNFEGIMAFSY